MKNHTKYIILILIIGLLTGIFIGQGIKIRNYKNGFNKIQKEMHLSNCSRCDNDKINIIPVNTGFYFECDDCSLRTYESESFTELIKFWNRER